ncbi:hypothetical protein V2J09_003399 [Rumex salicifolius]
MPVLRKRITKKTFQPIIEKIKSKLVCWKCRSLNLDGHITLVKSAISSIPTYSMSTVCFPIGFCNRIEKITRAFLWGNWDQQRRMHLVSKTDVCKKKKDGGLGINNLLSSDDSFFNKTDGGSYVWKGIQKGIQEVIIRGTRWNLRDDKLIRFWIDSWHTLQTLTNELVGPIEEARENDRVCDYWNSKGGWNWPVLSGMLQPTSLLRLASVAIRPEEGIQDSLSWVDSSSGISISAMSLGKRHLSPTPLPLLLLLFRLVFIF